MSYTAIAEETILMANATSSGSKEERTLVILERFSEEESITEIGISGEPLFVMGSRGNDMFFSFSPIQIQFTIIDNFGWLKKFANRNKKDFKLQVKNGEKVEFELYLYLPSNNSEYYERTPEIELVATNGIGLLKDEFFKPTDTFIEIKDFLFECVSRLGFDYEIEFYSLWASADNAKTFPLGYRINRSHQVRFDDSSRVSFYSVLENFCQQFNVQLYQIGQTWIFIERKRRLNAPATLNGIDLRTEAPVSRSLRSILTPDTVLRKPTNQFKPGLKEIQTVFKIGDELFKNIDLQESYIGYQPTPSFPTTGKKTIIPGWLYSTCSIIQNDSTLKIRCSNFSSTGKLEQKSKEALINIAGIYADKIILDLDFDLEAGVEAGLNDVRYLEILFHNSDGNISLLNSDLSWKAVDAIDNAHFFAADVSLAENRNVYLNLEFEPPEESIGYLELKFVFKNNDTEADYDADYLINSLSVDKVNSEEKNNKIFLNSRGIKNPSSVKNTFGQGDIDQYGFIFLVEYLNSEDEWVGAEYISNDGSTKSVFELAPYQRMCQANKDQIEYSTLRTWKYLYPDFVKTIVLDQGNEPDLYTIPLEIKWNMVTGEIEIFSVEALEDTTGITQLSFYSEDEYEAINSETVITDQGDVLLGFTKGTDSEDGRGFEVEFDAPNSATENTATIEIEGVAFEIETLILS